jgi:hypothetical protein
MNGYEIHRFKTTNGNFFVYEVDTLGGDNEHLVIGEGYYVDPEGNLLQSNNKHGKKRNPRRDDAMKERHWARENFGDDFQEEVIEGPLAEKLSVLFDRSIPKARTFGAPKQKESPFAALEALREKMGR